MIRPLRASYGARDNAHTLLAWDGPGSSPPALLLGLTDKPPGSLGPGDRWWPSVGCGPVEDWWALWWTQPDDQARRAGMVRSEVALWPVAAVGQVDDLRSVMESLSGGATITMPSAPLLGAVAGALLSPDRGRPIVHDLDAWPGVLAALWGRLWAEARRAFSARVAVSPPQGGESIAPPWLYGVPAERVQQWSGQRVIGVGQDAPPLSRAARWLVGEADASMKEVLSALPALPAELQKLRQAARAAEGLDRLRAEATQHHALALLRTLLALAPAGNIAPRLKDEALQVMLRSLGAEPSASVLALANLHAGGLPPLEPLQAALARWVEQRAPDLSPEDAENLFARLSSEKAEAWWRDTVRASLVKGMSGPESRWARAVLRWLGLSGSVDALRDLLPATGDMESRLVAVVNSVELAEPALRQVRLRAQERAWSRLHAWTVPRLLPPTEAFEAQWAFPGDPYAGLTFLVDNLPGAVVVGEAVSKYEARLFEIVAKRTRREPDLLRPMDPSHKAWRALWAAHVTAGGVPWPPGVSREAAGRDVLDAILGGDEPRGLIAALAPDLAKIAIGHPKRAALWDELSSDGHAALLSEVVKAFVRMCHEGHVFSTPEPPLAEAIVRKVRESTPSARMVATLMQWDVRLEERETISWLCAIRGQEWPPVADAIGHGVRSRRWNQAAEALYNRRVWMPEVRPAVEACQDCLPTWQRWVFNFFASNGPRTLDSAPLVHRVADLGARLAPDRLDDLWERAGGERKRLASYGAPDARWRDAATQADLGALKGGLRALIRVLRADYPHNPDLAEVDELAGSGKDRST